MNYEKAKFAMRLTGFFKEYVAVFYDSMVVFSLVNKKDKKNFIKNIKEEIKEKKISSFERCDYENDRWDDFANTYLSRGAEELLCENKNNFKLWYYEIVRVSFLSYGESRRQPGFRDAEEFIENSPDIGQVYFVSQSKKHHFNHYYRKDSKKRRCLAELFPDSFA